MFFSRGRISAWNQLLGVVSKFLDPNATTSIGVYQESPYLLGESQYSTPVPVSAPDTEDWNFGQPQISPELPDNTFCSRRDVLFLCCPIQ